MTWHRAFRDRLRPTTARGWARHDPTAFRRLDESERGQLRHRRRGASAGDDRSSWEQFLYSDPALPTTAYTSAPLSYSASGPGHVAMRSAWTKSAVWGALHSGAYINAAYSGEQGFEAGSLSVVVGGPPLLVNATGWIPKVAGTAGEDFVYEDSWGSGKRRLYNTFFVDDSTDPGNPGRTRRARATRRLTSSATMKAALTCGPAPRMSRTCMALRAASTDRAVHARRRVPEARDVRAF